MPLFLQSLHEIASIDWSRSYLWDIRFYDIPAPFDRWFPAAEVDENVGTVQSFDYEAFISSYGIPKGTTKADIKITFSDDDNHTVLEWLTKWIDNIVDENSGVLPLVECVKMVSIARLNLSREVLKTNHYLVYPEGPVYYQGNSNPDTDRYSVTFMVAGALTSEPGL